MIEQIAKSILSLLMQVMFVQEYLKNITITIIVLST